MNFSVLISVYKFDNSICLDKALDSVINQTLKPTEIVLVKDGELSKLLEAVIEKHRNDKVSMENSLNKILLNRKIYAESIYLAVTSRYSSNQLGGKYLKVYKEIIK